jgi:hypothetical protein
LKWEYQPQNHSRSWLATVRVQCRDLLRLLKDNPSLQPYLDDALQEAYENAKDLAMGETNLPEQTFPLSCSYALSEILGDHFYPGEPSELVDSLKGQDFLKLVQTPTVTNAAIDERLLSLKDRVPKTIRPSLCLQPQQPES